MDGWFNICIIGFLFLVCFHTSQTTQLGSYSPTLPNQACPLQSSSSASSPPPTLLASSSASSSFLLPPSANSKMAPWYTLPYHVLVCHHGQDLYGLASVPKIAFHAWVFFELRGQLTVKGEIVAWRCLVKSWYTMHLRLGFYHESDSEVNFMTNTIIECCFSILVNIFFIVFGINKWPLIIAY